MSHQQQKPRLLLVGWDAADWKIAGPLVDQGELPNLRRLIGRGVMADLATLQPVLSPMLWNSIATGHRPDRHGILGFTEVAVQDHAWRRGTHIADPRQGELKLDGPAE